MKMRVTILVSGAAAARYEMFCPICGEPFETFMERDDAGLKPHSGHTCEATDITWERACRDFVGIPDEEA